MLMLTSITLVSKLAFAFEQIVSKTLHLSSPPQNSRVIILPISARHIPEAAADFKKMVQTTRTRTDDSLMEGSRVLMRSASLNGSRLEMYSISDSENGMEA
nr:hypothetical protein C4D60_Mb04t26780 [Ipomoea batatas]